MSKATTFRGAAKLRRSGMFRSEPGGRGRFIGPKVLCRSYGAGLAFATGAGYKHGAAPELAPGALTSDLPALEAFELKGKDARNDEH